MNDHKLKQNVLDELAWEPSVVADHIGVTADNGVVSLSGHVESFWQKNAAETAAGRVAGLKALVNQLEIRLPLHFKREDDEVAAAAVQHLSWDDSLPVDAVKVKVDKGHVTLTGQVDWYFQKEAALNDVRFLRGVSNVTDNVTIKVRPDTKKLSDDITHALHRSWFFDEAKIKVSAVGGQVHLTGKADSWSDRDMAASTAWAAPGTTGVQNDIRVN